MCPCEHATDGGKSCSAIKARVQCKVNMVHKALRGVLTNKGHNMGIFFRKAFTS